MATARASESTRPPRRPPDLEPILQELAKKLAGSEALKRGTILLRTTGPEGRDYYMAHSPSGPRLLEAAASEVAPAVEVIGDARSIQSVLAGQKDARAQFLAGGFRVRGNLRYLSDVALELGILKEPL